LSAEARALIDEWLATGWLVAEAVPGTAHLPDLRTAPT
jgi:hypothetical protein